MTDVARATYLRLMQEIEALETQVEALQATPATGDPQAAADALQKATASLDEKRRELARLSAGCGRPQWR